MTRLWIAGDPAPFATAREGPWRAAVAGVLADLDTIAEPRGLGLAFIVSQSMRQPHGPDLDNLCEPVISTLCRAGWFGGRRPNMATLAATKRTGVATGCTVTVEETPDLNTAGADLLLDGTYAAVPQGARDTAFAAWVSSAMVRPGRITEVFAVDLALPARTNVAEIPTGLVKKSIDGLYPLLGGVAGAPADDRVVRLRASRRPKGDGVEVRVWGLSPSEAQ